MRVWISHLWDEIGIVSQFLRVSWSDLTSPTSVPSPSMTAPLSSPREIQSRENLDETPGVGPNRGGRAARVVWQRTVARVLIRRRRAERIGWIVRQRALASLCVQHSHTRSPKDVRHRILCTPLPSPVSEDCKILPVAWCYWYWVENNGDQIWQRHRIDLHHGKVLDEISFIHVF